MSLSRSRARALWLALFALLVTAFAVPAMSGGSSPARAEAGGVAAGHTHQDTAGWPRHERLRVDIAENGTRFAFDEAPVFAEDGMPAYGNSFVTEGYIYPAGTLNGSNGVKPDGSPEFPHKVIGQWLCRGYFIGDGAHTTEGAWVYTTQLFAFGDNPDNGRKTLVVVGYEGSEVGRPVVGAVTGGTGDYAVARGDASQKLLGFNNPDLPTIGINKRVSFRVAR